MVFAVVDGAERDSKFIAHFQGTPRGGHNECDVPAMACGRK
jgi:hypothetical protein